MKNMEILNRSDSLRHSQEDSLNAPSTTSVFSRLRSKSWGTRSSAYEEILSDANGATVFDAISECPDVFLEESTVRGQELALSCIIRWIRGTVSLSGLESNHLVLGLLLKYSPSSHLKIKELVVEIFQTICERFSFDRAMQYLHKALNDSSKSILGPVIKEQPTKSVARGQVYRQIIGILSTIGSIIVANKIDPKPTLTRLRDLLNESVVDRSIKEAGYDFLFKVHHIIGDAGLESMGLNEAQLKEAKSRLRPKSPSSETSAANRLNDSLIIKPEENSSRTTAASPSVDEIPAVVDIQRLLPKDWFEHVESSKWQVRRDAWSLLLERLKDCTTCRVSDDLSVCIIKTVKSDLNVPITIELCSVISRLSVHNCDIKTARNLLSVVTPRLKEKTQSVLKAVMSTMTCLLMIDKKQLLDNRFVDLLSTCPRKESLSLLRTLLPVSSKEILIISTMVVPSLSSDTDTRDLAIDLTKHILADLSTTSKPVLDECVEILRKCASQLSPARAACIQESLGICLVAPSLSRPKSGSSLPSSSRLLPVLPRRPMTAITNISVQRRENGNEIVLRQDIRVAEKMGWDPKSKLASKLRMILAPGSDTLIASMTARTGNITEVCKSVVLWTNFVEKSTPEILFKISTVLISWMSVVLAESRDHNQLWRFGIELVDRVVFPENDHSEIIPVLLDNKILKDRIGEVFKKIPQNQLTPHVCNAILKGRARQDTVTLLSELIRGGFFASKRDVGRTLLYALSTQSVSTDVVVGLADFGLKQILVSLLKTDNLLKETVRRTLLQSFLSATKREVTIKEDSIPPVITVLESATVPGESLVNSCVGIQKILESDTRLAARFNSRIIAAITQVVRPVLISDDSESRQSLLTLLHSVSRTSYLWQNLGMETLQPFIRELLFAVSDRSLRASEPEIWNDLNLSLVHAIANSDRPSALASLLGLSHEANMNVLVVRCIEKINRSLPQYLEGPSGEFNKSRLLDSFQGQIHARLISKGEEAVLEDDCVQTSLRGICSVLSLVELGEYVGMNVESIEERALWKKLLKSFSANEKRRKSVEIKTA